MTTRLIGALIMVHGDNEGLVIPPRVAPIQVFNTIFIFYTAGTQNISVLRQVFRPGKDLSRCGKHAIMIGRKKKAVFAAFPGHPLIIPEEKEVLHEASPVST